MMDEVRWLAREGRLANVEQRDVQVDPEVLVAAANVIDVADALNRTAAHEDDGDVWHRLDEALSLFRLAVSDAAR